MVQTRKETKKADEKDNYGFLICSKRNVSNQETYVHQIWNIYAGKTDRNIIVFEVTCIFSNN